MSMMIRTTISGKVPKSMRNIGNFAKVFSADAVILSKPANNGWSLKQG